MSQQQQHLLLQRRQQTQISSIVRPASQLRGLTFGNSKIDDGLLRGGLIPKTLTFLYGKNANLILNVLCSNSIRIFGGKAVFIDGANSFDPYFIIRNYSNSKKKNSNEKDAKGLIESIMVSRAFTCYQLRKLVTSTLAKEISKAAAAGGEGGNNSQQQQQIKSVFVSGISNVFNEEDNTQSEITRIEFLMAQALRKIASDKNNGVLFVVASSDSSSTNFAMKSDTVIKLFSNGDDEGGAGRRKASITKAVLMKHYAQRFKTVSF
jgi:hypothetical protein